MATKWKKLVYSPITKLVCFILVIVSVAGGLIATIVTDRNSYRINKEHSYEFYRYYGRRHQNALTEQDYASNRLEELLESAELVAHLESEQAVRAFNGIIDNAVSAVESEIGEYSSLIDGAYYYSQESAVNSLLIDFRYALDALEQSGLDYEIKTGDTVYSKGSRDSKYSLTVEGLVLNWNIDELQRNAGWRSTTTLTDEDSYIYLGTNAEDYPDYLISYSAYVTAQQRVYIICAAALLIGGISFIILLLGAGRSLEDTTGAITFGLTDRPYLDISLVLIFIVSGAILALGADIAGWFISSDLAIEVVAAGAVTLLLATPLLIWVLSFAKRIKAKHWWKHTLVYQCFSKLFAWIGHLEEPSKLIAQVILAVVLILLSMIPFVFLITIPATVFALCMYSRDYNRLRQGIKAVEGGDYSGKIDIKKGDLAPIARSIENISVNMDQAVDSQLKSERMKTELLANVSHDLRTPMTSIITYADLLKNKGLKSKEAPEYLDTLISKANRLKGLTDDLFEAAKATSGSMAIELEALDLTELVNQSVGEMEPQLEKSGLELVQNLPEQAMVIADGRMMHRVMENLLTNILKYSMEKSRVYIDIFEEPSSYRLELKNMSKTPLNISPDQLTQRFSRGDSSRSTEGSGLGLAIVESFVENQQGDFQVAIDGDLFKVMISLPKAQPTS